MRLQRGVQVADTEPELARAVIRLVSASSSIDPTPYVAERLSVSKADAASLIDKLTAHGFLERSPRGLGLTIAGGALSMASFNKPISRSTADKLLAQVIARAEAYDADDAKPFKIKTLRVFGSYLNSNVATLGDLDLALELIDRVAGWDDDLNAHSDYAQKSGRRFSNIIQALGWAQTEPLLLLRNRSSYINITSEDVSRFTTLSRQIYPL